jgi:outer membrane biosynthesis protein TonB
MSRNLRKIALIVIALMALAGFVSGVLGARDVAYLPGDAPSAPAASAPAIVAPEVTPLPTDLPPPPEPDPEPEPPKTEAPKAEDKPKPVTEEPAPAPSSNSPAGQDAVGDLIQDSATTQPPPY